MTPTLELKGDVFVSVQILLTLACVHDISSTGLQIFIRLAGILFWDIMRSFLSLVAVLAKDKKLICSLDPLFMMVHHKMVSYIGLKVDI